MIAYEQIQKVYCKKCGEPFWVNIVLDAVGNRVHEKESELCLGCWVNEEIDGEI